MRRARGFVAGLAGFLATLISSTSAAIDAPPGATDLRAGLEPLANHFDSEMGRNRLLLLLSPA